MPECQRTHSTIGVSALYPKNEIFGLKCLGLSLSKYFYVVLIRKAQVTLLFSFLVSFGKFNHILSFYFIFPLFLSPCFGNYKSFYFIFLFFLSPCFYPLTVFDWNEIERKEKKVKEKKRVKKVKSNGILFD